MCIWRAPDVYPEGKKRPPARPVIITALPEEDEATVSVPPPNPDGPENPTYVPTEPTPRLICPMLGIIRSSDITREPLGISALVLMVPLPVTTTLLPACWM